MHGILPKVMEINIKYKLQLRNNNISSRALFRDAHFLHSNVKLRFMVQALQDPPLCSSTIYKEKRQPTCAQCCGTGTVGTLTFCLSGTGTRTVINYGSVTGTRTVLK